MAHPQAQRAVVTGASTGLGFELARECARYGFDLLVVADEPAIQTAADTLRQGGVIAPAPLLAEAHCRMAQPKAAE